MVFLDVGPRFHPDKRPWSAGGYGQQARRTARPGGQGAREGGYLHELDMTGRSEFVKFDCWSLSETRSIDNKWSDIQSVFFWFVLEAENQKCSLVASFPPIEAFKMWSFNHHQYIHQVHQSCVPILHKPILCGWRLKKVQRLPWRVQTLAQVTQSLNEVSCREHHEEWIIAHLYPSIHIHLYIIYIYIYLFICIYLYSYTKHDADGFLI